MPALGEVEREREGGRERESQAGSVLSARSELDVGLELTNREIMTWAEIKSLTLNQLNHPVNQLPLLSRFIKN